MAECPTLLGDPAIAFVDGGYNTFIPLAQGTYSLAVQQTQDLASFKVSPVQYSAHFGFNDPLSTFQRPQRPAIDFAGLEFRETFNVGDAPEFDANSLQLDAAPVFNEQPPNLSFPNAPGALTATAPGPAPAVPNRIAPTEPDYVLPQVPDLESILLPLDPEIVIPTFDGQRPDVNLPTLETNWNFTPQEYVSALLDKIKAKVSGMLDGGTGLPAAIEQALWERLAARTDVEEHRAVQEVTEEFLALGWTEPNGILGKRLRQVRQNSQNQRVGQAREVSIEQARLEQSNLQFSVTSGIQLEGQLQQLFMQAQTLMLDSARFSLDASIRVFDAQVGVIRLEYEIYVQEAQVFEARIRGELAKAEVYRAQVEAAKAKGEINEQLVRRYEAQIRAVNAMAEFYNSRIAGFKAQVEADVSRVEGYRATVQAYAERVRAKESEWGGYAKGIDAQATRAGIYDTFARAFATRVSSVNENNRVRQQHEAARIAQHRAELDSYIAMLQKAGLSIQAEQARITSVAAAADARARIYDSEANVETAASAARDRSFQLGLERERARIDAALKDAEIRVNENIQLTGYLVEIQKTVGAILAQLSAGAMSAVNFSAGVSSSRSQSQSCSTNISLDGEV